MPWVLAYMIAYFFQGGSGGGAVASSATYAPTCGSPSARTATGAPRGKAAKPAPWRVPGLLRCAPPSSPSLYASSIPTVAHFPPACISCCPSLCPLLAGDSEHLQPRAGHGPLLPPAPQNRGASAHHGQVRQQGRAGHGRAAHRCPMQVATSPHRQRLPGRLALQS